ncbi:hypothetical protein B0H66DRAFT_618597 [Apodospora peruviana]|uniref:asparagine--tRNA ligase n=1 Tax=Apodospora peruviana TaxID=516989 RepID=A0AAE0IAJ5_9PEZI|nr:hypothetical protein B0H66DRAFT_618597 [Apodospora peruviana]
MRPIALRWACRPSSSPLARLLQSNGIRRHLSQNTHGTIAQLLQWKPAEETKNVVINGYVRSTRKTKNHRFVVLGDGSSIESLEAIVPTEQCRGVVLSVGTAVSLSGTWLPAEADRKQSHELHVDQIEVVGPTDAATYPIQKKYHTPEFLRTIPHLRSRTRINSALLRLRSDVIASLTQFFANQNFTQTHPPIITSSDCEGAGEVFTVSPAAESPSSANKAGPDAPFFGSQKYLSVSTQLHLEALAQSVGNVWTLSPVFRAEKSDTSRHLSEFYMLEAEMSFVDDLDAVMDLAENMLRSLSTGLFGSAVVQDLLLRPGSMASDLAPSDEVERRWKGLMQPSWPRITYTEAIKLLQQNAELFEHCPIWGVGLQSEHEKWLAESVGGGRTPVFVTNYPRDVKAFYMRASEPPSDTSSGSDRPPGATVECFDLLVPELCEIAGGSMREHRLGPLLDAMERHGLTSQSDPNGKKAGDKNATIGWYTDLRRWGSPPHGGFGIGFDRLLCYLSGAHSIRDIVAFPRWAGRCDC